MKRLSLWMMLIIPSTLFAQKSGIIFTSATSWRQVQEQAKAEHKYIFIDIYATWCVPCRMMDNQVYNSDSVGKIMDSSFISLKLQMDKTKKDSESTKQWYSFADSIKAVHKIPSYPTFLFLSPNGDLVYRSSGLKSKAEFIKDAQTALSSTQTTGAQLIAYREDKLSTGEMEKLALQILETDNKELADEIAQKVKRNTLDHLKPTELANPDHIQFIRNFPDLVTTKDNFFKALTSYKQKIDKIVEQAGFSDEFAEYTISREFIEPQIFGKKQDSNESPNWENLQKQMAGKFDANRVKNVLLDAQIRWYTVHKDINKVIKYTIQKIDMTGIDTTNDIKLAGINNFIYNYIFTHSDDPSILQKAIGWMEIIVNSSPKNYNWLDTYANLLYKTGKVNEAIHVEKKALEAIEGVDKHISTYQRDLNQMNLTLAKMKEGQPTWR
ncbi:thioredoxin family protein [Chitinophaga sp. Ak27]|uniref:thioredoxin family protein n=1 Tax=Chitinophaga sp. Ak27 TaxID=2726116 RepID=UPI00145C88BA|nr:thioredoxin family protein [Chitinophaga sp. Ak27]NLU94874.1 DUF255 domain-containing protein [Chitinophaga sp. Ak27]